MAAPALEKYADLKTAAAEAGITDLQHFRAGRQAPGDRHRAATSSAKNELWNAIKKHSGWENEISAEHQGRRTPTSTASTP